MRTVLWPLLLGAVTNACCNGETRPDKSAYTFVNPVPRELMREFTTDRPDLTDNPFTVDAGHLQLEMDFANFARDVSQGSRSERWEGGSFNIRLGLLNRLEVGIFVSPYIHSANTPSGGVRETHSGIGDTTLRGKFNFWGNDGGPTAFGLIVDLAFPTSLPGLGLKKTEAAVSFPIALSLGGGWDLGLMPSAEFRAREKSGYKVAWANSATLGHAITKSLAGYVEVTSVAGDGPHVATLDLGVAWALDPNTQLDLGANVGIARAADDLVVFSGLSRRF